MASKEKKEIKNSKDKTSFMKSFKAELKKVVWPTPKQLFNNTTAVLAIVIITALIVFVLDFTFEAMNKYGIDKIKEAVSNSSTDENIVSNENINETTDEATNETSEEDSSEITTDGASTENVATEENTNS